MKVALDLEEVLADTIRESCRSTDKLELEDFQNWDLDSYVWQVYMGVSDALWRHDPLSIDPVEPNLSQYVGTMQEGADELHILTARLHVDDQIALWLDHHNIPYDEIVSTDIPKYELDYDVYVDDNPSMHGECRLLLRHHPHNAQIDASASKSTDRIHSLSDAVGFVR